jgi:hypothetical protein
MEVAGRERVWVLQTDVPVAITGLPREAFAMTVTAEQIIRFADFHEQYTGRYIALADTKAALVLASAGGLLGYLAGSPLIKSANVGTNYWLTLVLAGSLLLLSVSFVLAFLVVWPRRKRSGKDLIFWKGVAAYHSARDYVTAFDNLDETLLAEHRLVHCYDLSRVCRTKYELLSRSLIFGAGGIGATVIALATHQILLS